MKLVGWYPTLEENTDTINSIGRLDEDDPENFIFCDEIGILGDICCYGFKPEVGQKVVLCTNYDEDDPVGWVVIRFEDVEKYKLTMPS